MTLVFKNLFSLVKICKVMLIIYQLLFEKKRILKILKMCFKVRRQNRTIVPDKSSNILENYAIFKWQDKIRQLCCKIYVVQDGKKERVFNKILIYFCIHVIYQQFCSCVHVNTVNKWFFCVLSVALSYMCMHIPVHCWKFSFAYLLFNPWTS